VTIDTLDR